MNTHSHAHNDPEATVAHSCCASNVTPAATVTDPVCGMTVDPATTPHHAQHQGMDYHFCSAGCRTRHCNGSGFTAKRGSSRWNR